VRWMGDALVIEEAAPLPAASPQISAGAEYLGGKERRSDG